MKILPIDENLEIEIQNKLFQGEEIRKIIQHPTGRYALLTSFRVIPIDILSIRKKKAENELEK